MLSHWQRLSKFRAAHPAVGAGRHAMKSEHPYLFTRNLKLSDYTDQVLIGLDLQEGEKVIDVTGIFENGSILTDFYSAQKVEVSNGKAIINSPFSIVLFGLKPGR